MASKFRKARRGGEKVVDLDITSLLDIITILLVFLLQSYNTTDLTLDVASNLTLPDSQAEALGSHAVIIQVNKDKHIFLGNKHIGSAHGLGDNIPFLHEALEQYNKENDQKDIKDGRTIASVDGKGPPKRKANLVFDKEIPYKVMKQIMATAAGAGFSEFKFIVQSHE